MLHAKPTFIPSVEIMQRLKRVFNIDIEVCEHCGGQVKVIASIDKSAGEPICTTDVALGVGHREVTNEHPKVIEQILKHLKQKAARIDTTNQHKLPSERAPPLAPSLFDPSQSRLFD